MEAEALIKSLVLRHMRAVPGFVRATEGECPFEVPDGELIGWYRSQADGDHSVVFTTMAIRWIAGPEDSRTVLWTDIVAFEAPWRDKRAYREHRSLRIQSADGWKRIRMGITDEKFPHVDPLAQILHALYPIADRSDD